MGDEQARLEHNKNIVRQIHPSRDAAGVFAKVIRPKKNHPGEGRDPFIRGACVSSMGPGLRRGGLEISPPG
jgi:hypothetical protein